MQNIRAQIVRLVGEIEWRVNLMFEDGRDIISDTSFETHDDAKAALDALCLTLGVVAQTLH